MNLKIMNVKEALKSILSDKRLYIYRAYRAYYFGEKEIKYLKRIIVPTRPVLDIGANLGEYSFWLEKYADEVILFEPHPQCVEFLNKVISERTTVYPIALSNNAQKGYLSVPIDQNSLDVTCRSTLSETAVSEFNDLSSVPIQMKKLDDLDIKDVGYAKIDVEGHEREVLEGGEKTFTVFKPILQIEIEQRHLDYPMVEVIKYVESFGYDSYFFDGANLIPYSNFDLIRDQLSLVEKVKKEDSLAKKKYINNFIFISQR